MARFIVDDLGDGIRQLRAFQDDDDAVELGSSGGGGVDPEPDTRRPELAELTTGSPQAGSLSVDFISDEALGAASVFINTDEYVMGLAQLTATSNGDGRTRYAGTVQNLAPQQTVVVVTGEDEAGNESLPIQQQAEITGEVVVPPALSNLDAASSAPGSLAYSFRSTQQLDSCTVTIDDQATRTLGDLTGPTGNQDGTFTYSDSLTGLDPGSLSIQVVGVADGLTSNTLTRAAGVQAPPPTGSDPVGLVVDHLFDTVDDALAHTGWVVGETAYVRGYHQAYDGGGGLFEATTSGLPTDFGTVFIPEEALLAEQTDTIGWPQSGNNRTYSLSGTNIEARSLTLTIQGDLFAGGTRSIEVPASLMAGQYRFMKHEYGERGLNTQTGTWREAGAKSEGVLSSSMENVTYEFAYRRASSTLRIERIGGSDGAVFPQTGQWWDIRYFGAQSHRRSPFYDNQGAIAWCIRSAHAANQAAAGTVSRVLFDSDIDEFGGRESETVYYVAGVIVWAGGDIEYWGPGGMETYAYTDRYGVVHDGSHEFAKAQPVRRTGADVRVTIMPAGRGFHPLEATLMQLPWDDPNHTDLTAAGFLGCNLASTEAPSNQIGKIQFTGFTLDGNQEEYLASIYSTAFGSARESWLRNSPGYCGFNNGNHGDKVVPDPKVYGNRVEFTDMVIENYASHCIQGNVGQPYTQDPPTWPSEHKLRRVILGSCSYNHQWYGQGWVDAEDVTVTGEHWTAVLHYGGRVRNLFCVFNPNRYKGEKDGVTSRGRAESMVTPNPGPGEALGSAIEFVREDLTQAYNLVDSNGSEMFAAVGMDLDTFFIDMGVGEGIEYVAGRPLGVAGVQAVATNGYVITPRMSSIVRTNNNGSANTFVQDNYFEHVYAYTQPEQPSDTFSRGGNGFVNIPGPGTVCRNWQYGGHVESNEALTLPALRWRKKQQEPDRVTIGNVISGLGPVAGSTPMECNYFARITASSDSMRTQHFVELMSFGNKSTTDIIRGGGPRVDTYAGLGSGDAVAGLALADKIEIYARDVSLRWYHYSVNGLRMELSRHMMRMKRVTDLLTGNTSEETGQVLGNGTNTLIIDTNLLDRPRFPLRDCWVTVDTVQIFPTAVEVVDGSDNPLGALDDHRAPRLKLTFAQNIALDADVFYDFAVHRWYDLNDQLVQWPDIQRPSFWPSVWPWTDHPGDFA